MDAPLSDRAGGGGGLYLRYPDLRPSAIVNSIIWGNKRLSSADQIQLWSGASLEIAWSDLEEGVGAVDYWVLAGTPQRGAPLMSFSFPDKAWVPGREVSFQGRCLKVSAPYEVLRGPDLPPGGYQFYIGVDLVRNGLLDKGSLHFDSVAVTVVE